MSELWCFDPYRKLPPGVLCASLHYPSFWELSYVWGRWIWHELRIPQPKQHRIVDLNEHTSFYCLWFCVCMVISAWRFPPKWAFFHSKLQSAVSRLLNTGATRSNCIVVHLSANDGSVIFFQNVQLGLGGIGYKLFFAAVWIIIRTYDIITSCSRRYNLILKCVAPPTRIVYLVRNCHKILDSGFLWSPRLTCEWEIYSRGIYNKWLKFWSFNICVCVVNTFGVLAKLVHEMDYCSKIEKLKTRPRSFNKIFIFQINIMELREGLS